MMRMGPSEYVVFSIIAGVVLVSLAAIVGGLLHARRERLLTHAERMRALELGRPAPDEAALAGVDREKSAAGRCFSATGHACFWGFLFAIGAASREGGNAPGAAYAIAAAAGAVGVTGLICGTVLASRTPASARTEAPVKPRFDPDAI